MLHLGIRICQTQENMTDRIKHRVQLIVVQGNTPPLKAWLKNIKSLIFVKLNSKNNYDI